MAQRFSRRIGPLSDNPPITIREDAPAELRTAVFALAESFGVGYIDLVKRIVRLFGVPRDSLTRGQRATSEDIVRHVLAGCEWHHVYDIIEEICGQMAPNLNDGFTTQVAQQFTGEINDYFRRHGIGFQLVDGAIQHRGDDAPEQAVRQALAKTEQSGLDSAHRELSEALEDLSKRPQPDLTGAITHSITALETVAREVANDQNATLGKILNDNPNMFPKPLDQAVEKIWGYASQYGRHVTEGKGPTFDEAELAVHVSSAAATYLVRKAGLADVS